MVHFTELVLARHITGTDFYSFEEHFTKYLCSPKYNNNFFYFYVPFRTYKVTLQQIMTKQ